jgi:predicted LPLAT superfamily acyltransferase
VPVILCFGLYKGGNHYSLHFELLSEQLTATRKTREQEINRVMAHYSSRLEYYVKQAPYNWFNFYDFWHNESTTDN